MKKMLMAGALLLAGLAYSTVAASEHPCRAAADEELAKVGLTFADLETADWIAHTRGESGQVRSYQLYSRPRDICTTGNLVLSFSKNCFISTLYTSGGCRVDGVNFSPRLF